MAQRACCNAPISRLTEAVCTRCRAILGRKIDAIQAQLYKFREESETDSQPTMKPVGQYGRAVPQSGVSLKTTNALSDGQGHAEAEGQKRIEVACGPSRNRTLESGEAGEMKAGGDDSNATIGSALVGGLTARRDGQDCGAVANGQASTLCASVGLRGSAPSDGEERRDGTGDGDPGSSPGCSTNTKPQRVRFGPGAVPVTEGWYQRRRREAQAYYDAMQRDVTSSHVWPVRECAGGCGDLVNGSLDRCRLCRARVISERHELEWEEANG